MTLEASFAALLYRYTGQDDLLVGTPISGRTLSGTEDLIGCILNMVVLRSRLDEGASFRSLLRQTRERALGAYGHSELPFGRLVAELAPERDPSRTPLFQAMFVLHESGSVSETSTVGGIQQFATGTAKFDLTLTFSETGDSLAGLIEYSTDLFEAETIRAMCRHYVTLLEAMAGAPDRRLSALPMLTAEDRSRLLGEWNATAMDYPKQLCLHQLLAEQAQRAPEQVAAVCGEASISYGELDRRSNRLAQHLRALGAGPDVLIGLLVERSLEMVVGLLGILKAGSAYVPLDPAFPANRLAYMIENSRLSILVTHRGLEEALAVRPPAVVRMDSDAERIAGCAAELPEVAGMSPERLAYVLYTSGSTGKPKGVAIPHSAIVNFLCSMRREPGFSSDDTLLAVTTLSFDIAGLELYLPLLCGGRVAIAGSAEAQDPRRLMERIRQSACTVLQATPATFRALLDAGWQPSPKLKLLCGGEALLPDLAEALLARCGELWNMYGPTETTVWSALHRVSAAEGPIAIGKPIGNTQLYVLDAHGNLAAPGVPGELYIGGDGLARGYLHREELTAERFVASPSVDGARLYRTGDLARWHRDGTMECLGRVDNQVKLRGFRIELGEVEAVLSAYPGIRQCTVVLAPDAAGGGQLAAYYETVGYETAGYESERAGARARAGDDGRPRAEIPAAELRAHLSKELPPYMVPGVFVAMAKLPLTPNGKIDRKALAASTGELVVEREFVAPRNEIEQLLAQIWARVLKVSRVGMEDNFFELGGHSLLAVRVVLEIEKLCHIRLPLAVLLQSPTVAGLAVQLRQQQWQPSWSSLVPLHAQGSRPPVYLMHAHGGNTLEYHTLANLLGPEQPVYALQARGLNGRIVCDPSIEEMASTYVEEIRSMQPEGPYYLGGFCFGGLLALEAAQQLTAAGEQVPLLVMIQTTHPRAMRFREEIPMLQRWGHMAAKRLSLELENLSYRGAGYISERLRFAWDRARATAALAQLPEPVNGSRDFSHLPMQCILDQLAKEHSKAVRKYEPRRYDGDVLLFRASRQLRGQVADELLGWREILCGDLEVHELRGHQQNLLLMPNVVALAGIIGSRLQQAQEKASIAAPEAETRAIPV